MAFKNYSLTPSANVTIAGNNVGEQGPSSAVGPAAAWIVGHSRPDGRAPRNYLSYGRSTLGQRTGGLIGFEKWIARSTAYVAYAPATAYAVNTTDLDQGALWVNIAASTGAAPPTPPTTSTALWKLVDANPDGQLAQVPTTDTGTHTDPFVGGTVTNRRPRAGNGCTHRGCASETFCRCNERERCTGARHPRQPRG